MSRKILLPVLLLLFSVSVTALDIQPFQYRDPAALSLGGVSVYGSEGVHTLHTNPALFSLEESVDYTVLSVAPWLSLAPSAFSLVQGDASGQDFLDAGRSGFGSGAQAMTGLTGKGVGLGILTGTEFFAAGDGSSLAGYIDSELSLVVGYAAGFSLGPVDVVAAGDIRPLLRVFAPLTQTDVLAAGEQLGNPADMLAVLGGVANPYYGAGLGFDLGAGFSYAGLDLGFVIRDVGDTVLGVTRPEDVDAAWGEMYTLTVDSLEGESPETLSVPMRVAIGLRYRLPGPVWGLTPLVYGEIDDLFPADDGLDTVERLHAGLDFGLPGPFSLRAGVSAGGPALGAGLDLPILAVDAAWYRTAPRSGAERAGHGFVLEGRLEF